MSDHSRQLAAVMFTDISGYTALMGRSEERALELLHTNRQIHKQLIEKYHGTWIKEMGDGVLAQFGSVYNAVQCAIAIQNRARTELRAKLRIGIHSGEIIVEDGDIFGDGVNIAARVESIAEPGSIYVTESIIQSLQNKKGIRTRYLAEVQLKNVDSPIRVYCILAEGIATPNQQRIELLRYGQEPWKTRFKRISGSPLFILFLLVLVLGVLGLYRWYQIATERSVRSIAVLPFANLTGNADEQYFVDMMHDAVITEISGIKNLIVKSRTSSLRFRGEEHTIPEIARMLNVDAVLESTVYKTGDSVYINVQLIKSRPVEKHLWAQDYKRDTRNILSLYGDLAKDVAKDIEISLSPAMDEYLTHKKEVDPNAYKAYMRGQYHWHNLSAIGMDSAEYYFKISRSIDPDYALAYAGLASVALTRAQFGIIPFHEAAIDNIKFLDKAIELDSSLSQIHFLSACFNTWGLWNFKKAEADFLKAIEKNPNYALAHIYYAQLLCILNRYNDAENHSETAWLLDPFNTLIKIVHSQNENFMRKPGVAIPVLEEIRKSEPYNGFMLSTLRTSYHITGEYDKAIEVWKDSYIRDTLAYNILSEGYKKSGYRYALRQLGDYMIKKSENEFVTPWRICTIYTRSGENVKAIEWLEMAFHAHDQNMPFISTDPIFDDLKTDHRFQTILKRMNLDGV